MEEEGAAAEEEEPAGVCGPLGETCRATSSLVHAISRCRGRCCPQWENEPSFDELELSPELYEELGVDEEQLEDDLAFAATDMDPLGHVAAPAWLAEGMTHCCCCCIFRGRIRKLTLNTRRPSSRRKDVLWTEVDPEDVEMQDALRKDAFDAPGVGPRCVLAAGLRLGEAAVVRASLDRMGMQDVKVIAGCVPAGCYVDYLHHPHARPALRSVIGPCGIANEAPEAPISLGPSGDSRARGHAVHAGERGLGRPGARLGAACA